MLYKRTYSYNKGTEYLLNGAAIIRPKQGKEGVKDPEWTCQIIRNTLKKRMRFGIVILPELDIGGQVSWGTGVC